MLPITALAAAALALQLIQLSVKVFGHRRAGRVSIGSGGNDGLERAIRAQGNLTEYAPIALILLACLEINGGSPWLLVPLALAFVVGRVLHPFGMTSAGAPAGPRIIGMHLTVWPIVALALLNAVQAVRLLAGG